MYNIVALEECTVFYMERYLICLIDLVDSVGANTILQITKFTISSCNMRGLQPMYSARLSQSANPISLWIT